jgi:RimK family alpha-L-glutamate ligase
VSSAQSIWILANLGLGPKFEQQAELHQIAFTNAGLHASIIDSQTVLTSISQTLSVISSDGQGYTLPKVAMLGVKDTTIGTALSHLGVTVLNSPTSVALCDDKRATQLVLQRAGVPMPASIFPPHLYPRQPAPDYCEQAAVLLGLPLVGKEVRGSFGRQVTLLSTVESLRTYVNELGARPYLLQEYVRASHGRDIRVQVIGAQCVAAISRQAVGDHLQANLTLGSVGAPLELRPELSEIALRAVDALGLVNAGVDIVLDESESPLVIEVNSNAHIARISSITGVDCAAAFAEFVVAKYYS